MDQESFVRRLEKLQLSEREKGRSHEANDEEIATAEKTFEFTSVCKILTDRFINIDSFKIHMPRIWGIDGKVRIERAGRNFKNIFVCEFKNKTIKSRIIERGPWIYDRSLLLFEDFMRDSTIAALDFRYAVFWVRFIHVPVSCRCLSTAQGLGNSIGDFVAMDDDEFQLRYEEFFRVKVRLDLSIPLARTTRLKIGSMGEEIWLPIRYEKLPEFCLNCGKIGHLVKGCELEEIKIEGDYSFSSDLREGGVWGGEELQGNLQRGAFSRRGRGRRGSGREEGVFSGSDGANQSDESSPEMPARGSPEIRNFPSQPAENLARRTHGEEGLRGNPSQSPRAPAIGPPKKLVSESDKAKGKTPIDPSLGGRNPTAGINPNLFQSVQNQPLDSLHSTAQIPADLIQIADLFRPGPIGSSYLNNGPDPVDSLLQADGLIGLQDMHPEGPFTPNPLLLDPSAAHLNTNILDPSSQVFGPDISLMSSGSVSGLSSRAFGSDLIPGPLNPSERTDVVSGPVYGNLQPGSASARVASSFSGPVWSDPAAGLISPSLYLPVYSGSVILPIPAPVYVHGSSRIDPDFEASPIIRSGSLSSLINLGSMLEDPLVRDRSRSDLDIDPKIRASVNFSSGASFSPSMTIANSDSGDPNLLGSASASGVLYGIPERVSWCAERPVYDAFRGLKGHIQKDGLQGEELDLEMARVRNQKLALLASAAQQVSSLDEAIPRYAVKGDWKRRARNKSSLSLPEGDMDIDNKDIHPPILGKRRLEVSATSTQSFSQGHIDVNIRASSGDWRFTGFYGNPDVRLRSDSWNLLRRLYGLNSLPWIVGGDFNEVLSPLEQINGGSRSSSSIKSFQDAVDDCLLVDPRYVHMESQQELLFGHPSSA